jgi:hypothetical protein
MGFTHPCRKLTNFATEDGMVFGHTWPTFCPSQNCENVEGMWKDSARQ